MQDNERSVSKIDEEGSQKEGTQHTQSGSEIDGRNTPAQVEGLATLFGERIGRERDAMYPRK